jgi:hypothetical protein
MSNRPTLRPKWQRDALRILASASQYIAQTTAEGVTHPALSILFRASCEVVSE